MPLSTLPKRVFKITLKHIADNRVVSEKEITAEFDSSSHERTAKNILRAAKFFDEKIVSIWGNAGGFGFDVRSGYRINAQLLKQEA